jgi:hypothetical protein
LSRVEKEAIWGRIEAARAPWWRRRATRLGAAGLASAIATVVVVLAVTSMRPPADELTPRGAGATPLALRCSADREPGDCRRGDRLVFDFGTNEAQGYVALFARSPAGTVIWYVPADDATASISLADHSSAGVLDTAAVIDDSYEPGRYELFAVISERPLSRADIRGFERGDRLVAAAGAQIETRAFVVTVEEEVP